MGKSSVYYALFLRITTPCILKMIEGQSHFGLEPKIISNPSSSRRNAIFRPIGRYAAHTATINVRIPFQFGQWLNNIQVASARISNYTNKVNHYYQDKFNTIARLHKDQLADTRQQFIDQISVLPTAPPAAAHRQTRFFGLAVATAAVGFAAANRYQLIKQESKIKQLTLK